MFQIERILFPTDLSDATARLAPLVKQLAELFDAELHVILVVADPISREIISHDLVEVPDFQEYQKELIAALGNRLTGFVKDSFPDLKDKKTSIVTGDAAEGILQYAKDNSIDLIIMGSTTKPGLAEKIFGGTVYKVTANAPCPVMTVNPFKMKE